MQGAEGALLQSLTGLPAVLGSPPLAAALLPLDSLRSRGAAPAGACDEDGGAHLCHPLCAPDVTLCSAAVAAPPEVRWLQVSVWKSDPPHTFLNSRLPIQRSYLLMADCQWRCHGAISARRRFENIKIHQP